MLSLPTPKRIDLDTLVVAVPDGELPALIDVDGDGAAPPPMHDPSAADASDLVSFDPQTESSAQYRLRMGKYRREVLQLMKNSVFWFAVEMVDRATQPLSHMQHFLQAKHPDFIEKGTAGSRITCGKGDSIFREFEKPFRDLEWARELFLSDLAAVHTSELLVLQVELSLHCAAGYYRRIVEASQQCLS